MKRRTRTILFAFFLFLFLVASPAIVLYSQGYRFDMEAKKIVKTGGLYFKVFPKGAEAKVGEGDARKTDYLTGSFLEKNLIPGAYEVSIKKEGYHSWEKTLEVTEEIVTEAKSVVLFPLEPSFTDLFEDSQAFFVSPDGKKVVAKTATEEGWSLKLYEPESGIKSLLLKEKDYFPEGAEFLRFEFKENSKDAVVSVAEKEQAKNYIFSTDRLPISLKEEESQIPYGAAFKETEGKAYSLDYSGYVTEKGSSQEGIILNKNPFPVKQETEYEIFIANGYVFLQEEKELFWLKPGVESFENVFSGTEGIKASPDKKKIAVFSNSEIWVIFLADATEQPFRKAEEKIFLTRVSERIKSVFWLNNDYLVFNSNGSVKITETDDRGKINIIELASFESPEISWSVSGKRLYVLTENVLKESEKLIP